MTEMVNVAGIDKAELLVAMFDAANPPKGIAATIYSASDTLTVDEARTLFNSYTDANPYRGQPMFIDYLKGRKLRIDLDGDEIDAAEYNKANGAGKVQQVVAAMRGRNVEHAPSDAPSIAEVKKLQAYAAREMAQTNVLTGKGSQFELDVVQHIYEDTVLPGNKNAFVPWSDTLIPFECDCGKIIYADTEHTH